MNLYRGDLPDAPEDRLVIVPMDDNAWREVVSGSHRAAVSRKDAAYLKIRDAQDAESELTARLSRSGLLRAGKVLVQSPFDRDNYQLAQDAQLEFAVQKFLHISHICMLLGAQEFKVSQESRERTSEDSSGEVSAPVHGLQAGARAQRKFRRDLQHKVQLHQKYDPSVPQVEKAEQFVRDHGLEGDSQVTALVRARREGHVLTDSTLRVNLTSEAETALELAVQVGAAKVPGVTLKGNHVKLVRREFTLVTEVKFPPRDRTS